MKRVPGAPVTMALLASRTQANDNGCWEWMMARSDKGYGRIQVSGANRLAHKVSYELVNGLVPEGLVLDHLCRNRACINPAHLEPVTQYENIMRGQGVGVINSKKTVCPRGHPLTPDNLVARRKDRVCRKCANKAAREAKALKRKAMS